MRIGLVSTLASRVRPTGTDSVEGLVWLLARELTRRGHDVTVFACAGSECDGRLVATMPGPYDHPDVPEDWQAAEWTGLCRAVAGARGLDVLHSHVYLWGLALEPLAPVPMVHTLHVMPYETEARLLALAPRARVTALSRWQWAAHANVRPAAVVPNAVAPEAFTFRPDPEDYVCFLGRLVPGKGPLAAIALARALGVRLLMAGPRTDYFDRVVAPEVDGRHVVYVGPVAGDERDALLGGARALLYPLADAEPFGLVPVEAMLCGTPVLATPVGAAPEVVEDGVTGVLATDPVTLAARATEAFALDRAAVRARAALRFSVERMVEGYLDVYARAVAA